MSILDDIARYKRHEIASAMQRAPLRDLEARARAAGKPRGFLAALKQRQKAGKFGIVAEIKKASPSKGVIREQFRPEALARAYEAGGAQCLSVLTDRPSFQGAPEHLAEARQACALPLLRKDFMLDPYQVAEARVWGADCILIILAMVGDEDAKTLLDSAAQWSMDTLVEVHDENEMNRALALGAAMIGINNRDLHSFETDLATTGRLATMVPKETLAIAESGIRTRSDLERLGKCGVTTFLVGESLMRKEDVTAALRELLGG